MPESVDPPLIPTPEALVQRAIAQLQAQYPNFKPNPASPEWRMFLAFAAICCETIILAFDVPEEEIIRVVGERLYQVLRNPALFATTTSTWEATDALGYVIPAGTVVIVTPEGGTPVAFEVTEEAEVKVGETKTTAGTVKLRALNGGAEGNIPGASTAEPNELLAWVKAIALVTPPAGGEEEETTKAYVQRIRELAKIFKPEPILPEDFANYVRLLVPGIARCIAIDLLELKEHHPDAEAIEDKEGSEVEAEGVERCVTVVPITAAGAVPSLAVLEQAYARLAGGTVGGVTYQAAREGTFKSFVGLPTFHPVAVTVVGKFFKGFTEAVVKANVEEALNALLSPANCGVPATGDATSWVNKKTLRYQDVVTALNNVQGFNYYTELKVNGKEEDVTLTGIAPLTEAGALSVTLTVGTE